jgi:RNA polymerase sigma-70 factor (ECF subfamily)
MTDEELVEKIQAGDRESCEILYARYQACLFSYLKRLIQDDSAAADICQELFVDLLTRNSFRFQGRPFRCWIFTVARHRGLSYRRDRQRRTARLQENSRLILDNPSQDIEAEFSQRQRQQAIQKMLATLSPEHQEVLLLKEVGELTYQEIAEILEIPEGTVKSRLHWAIQTMRQLLRKRQGDIR